MEKLFRGAISAGVLLVAGMLSPTRDAGALEPLRAENASGQLPAVSPRDGGQVIRVAAKVPKKKTKAKKGAAKKAEMDKEQGDEMKAEAKPAAAPAPAPAPAQAAGDDKGLKFSRDIAPTFVGLCVRCHNPKDMNRRGKFDLTTFNALLKGGETGAAIVPGKPEESELIKRVRGESTPKMPPGQNDLAEVTIERLETWIKAGAVLDAGLDPKAPMASYAVSAEARRREELAKLNPEERDKLALDAARARWNKGAPKTAPENYSDAHFLLLGTLPKERAKDTLKVLEAQYTTVKQLTGMADPPVKIVLLAFNDLNSFVEFARSAESREVEPGENASARLEGLEPYIAVVDPLGGGADPTLHAAKSASTKKAKGKDKEADDGASGDRTLPGLFAEQLAIGALQAAGKPPAWLSLGLGAYMAARVEPRSPYVGRLRRAAYEQCEKGWTSPAIDALGGETKNEEIRPVALGIVEAMSKTPPKYFVQFVRGMLAGQGKLDDVVLRVYNWNREQFLAYSGEYVGTHYGGRRR